MKPEPTPEPCFRARLCSDLIDLALIYAASILLRPLLWTIGFIPLSWIFTLVFIAYFSLLHALAAGRTIGKMLCGLQLTQVGGNRVSLKKTLLRELIFKGLVPLVLPRLWLENRSPLNSVVHPIAAAVGTLLVSGVLFLRFKRTWWDQLSGTVTRRNPPTPQARKTAYRIFAAAAAAAMMLSVRPIIDPGFDFKNRYWPDFPQSSAIYPYVEFVGTHMQDPVDYIFNLFDRYDVVVLSERLHPEYTQYNFIRKIIEDERFTRNVGNVFTECGSVSFQDTLDRYLNTEFETDAALDSSTADLQRNSNAIWPVWPNTNLFDMFRFVNKLNHRLPDSARVHWYFTDLPVDWRTMNHASYLKSYTGAQRDSLMGAVVIRQYQSAIAGNRRHKALVIMNTRHGYGLNKRGNRAFDDTYLSATAFMMKGLPGKVANVLLNTASAQYGALFTPIRHGKWDRAFEEAGNPDGGFDLEGSPFGEDHFDLNTLSAPDMRYKDVFTGFVFFTPIISQVKSNGYPCMYDNFQDSARRRAICVSESYVNVIQRDIDYYEQHRNAPVFTEGADMAVLLNLLNCVVLPVWLLLSLFLASWRYYKRV